MSTETRDLRGELQDYDGNYPESWKPEVGYLCVGELLRYDSGSTEFGDYVIAVIRDDDTGEERSVWLMHEVLRREFAKRRPKPGERLGIKRLDDDAEKNYKRYALRVDREEALPDFNKLAGPTDHSPDQTVPLVDEEYIPF
jgi:hypothetical protein